MRSVALFLVNRRKGSNHHFRDVTYVFQAGLRRFAAEVLSSPAPTFRAMAPTTT